jgi:hypothetical protein
VPICLLLLHISVGHVEVQGIHERRSLLRPFGAAGAGVGRFFRSSG